jgi:hypothetical protein
MKFVRLVLLWWTQTSHDGFSSDAFVAPHRHYGHVREGRRVCAPVTTALTNPLGRLSSSSSSSNNNNNNNKDSDYDIPKDIIANVKMIVDEQERTNYLDSTKSAQAFIKSLMQAEYQDIPNSGGMRVLKNISDLESGESGDIVVRQCTIPFWEECIKVVNTPNMRYRVAAIGMAGTGKTISTPILIRMLLERNMTVVFLVQSEYKHGWYYKFVPDGTGRVTARIFSKKIGSPIVTSNDPATYYIVDPGKSKNDCNPRTDFLPKVILVASPDSRHWGGSEFIKRRGTVKGIMRYFPVWTKQELIFAQPILRPDMTSKIVSDRFNVFGGVPRQVFGRIDTYELMYQDSAVRDIAADEATCTAYEPNFIGIDYFSEFTKFAVWAFQLQEDDDGSFRKVKSIFVSSLVYRKVSEMFMAQLWDSMLSRGSDGGLVFEDYACRVMTGGMEMDFKARNCVYQTYSFLPLGGCNEMRKDNNPVEAARLMPDILFRPNDSSYPLIDFVYRNATGHFHAFQATIQKEGHHKASIKEIKKLQDKVGGGSNLSLYCLVPEEIFEVVDTDNANPKMKDIKIDEEVTCNIWHVLIPKPALTQPGLPRFPYRTVW